MNEMMMWLVLDAILAVMLFGYWYCERRRRDKAFEEIGRVLKARMELMDKALETGDDESFKFWQEASKDFTKSIGKLLG